MCIRDRLKERLVPELLQDEFTPEALVELAQPLLDDSSPERNAMLHGYGRLRATLGELGVTTRASRAIFDQLM